MRGAATHIRERGLAGSRRAHPRCRLFAFRRIRERRAFIRVAFCAVLLFFGAAQAESQSKGPRIEVGDTEVDLGSVFYTKSFSHVFEFRNVGDVPLTLEVKKRSCQCLSDLFDCAKVNPGAEGRLKVAHAPKNPPTRAGLNSFTVLVGTNDPEKPELLFSVKVRLVRSVEAVPSSLDFGRLSNGEESVKEFVIECFGESGVPEILSCSCPSPLLTVEELLREHEKDGASRIRFRAVLKAPEAPGAFGTAIQCETTCARIPFLEIPVQAFVPYPLRVQPERVLFGVVEPGTPSSRAIRLQVPPSVPDSLRWTCPDERITADFAPGASEGERVLHVSLSTSLSEGKGVEGLKTAISILSGDEEVVAKIPVHAVIKRPESE